MKRTLVIGDIHGGLKGLTQVLTKCQLQKEDHLIFLGDYVDGWSESAQVINFLIELEKEYQRNNTVRIFIIYLSFLPFAAAQKTT